MRGLVRDSGEEGKSGLDERAKGRTAHTFKKQTRNGGGPSVVKLRVLHRLATRHFLGVSSLLAGRHSPSFPCKGFSFAIFPSASLGSTCRSLPAPRQEIG